MKFNCLIPEFSVFDLEKSKDFYVNILGFEVKYSRKGFLMIAKGRCQIMLQQLDFPLSKNTWNVTDKLKYPLGQGINFQIIVKNIKTLYKRLKKNNYPIFVEPKENVYMENNIAWHVLEFLVQDPDGYLLRFQQDL